MKTPPIFKKSGLIALATALVLVMLLAASITVFAADYVAIVGGTTYTDIDTAVADAIKRDQTLTLNSDASIYIAPYKTIVVDKAGFALATTTKEGWNITVLDNCDGTVTVSSYKDFGEKFDAMKLRLDGSITMVFYLKNIEVLKNNPNAYLEVKTPTRSGTYNIEKYSFDDLAVDTKDPSRYVVSVRLAAAQQTDKVIFQIVNDGERGQLRQYSVRDYADIVLGDPVTYEKAVDPVKAMLNYGAMAQVTMDYNPHNLANTGLYEGGNPVIGITAEKVKGASDTVSPDYSSTITEASFEANLTSETGMFFYFKVSNKDMTPTATVKAGNGEAAEISPVYDLKKGAWRVEISNIMAHKLSVDYTVEFSCGDETLTITRSILNYIKDVLDSDSTTEDQKNAAAALYNYYVYLRIYLGDSFSDDDASCTTHTEYTEITKAATCTESGTAVTKCSVCGKTLFEETTVSPTGHTIEARAAIAAGCSSNGWATHWECTVCGKLFSDADATQETTMAELSVSATGHDELTIGVWDASYKCYMSKDACSKCGNTYPVMGNINMTASVINSSAKTNVTLTPSSDGKYVTYTRVAGAEDNYIIPYTNGGTTVSGQYMIIKYRTCGYNNGLFSVYTSSTVDGADGSGTDSNYQAHSLVVNGTDNKDDWHYIIADLTVHYGFTKENDEYSMNFFRIGKAAEDTQSVDLAYIVIADDLGNLIDSVKTFDEDAKDLVAETTGVCEHPSYAQSYVFVDGKHHAATCMLCGYVAEGAATGAHSGSSSTGYWNKYKGYYVSDTVCEYCNEYYALDYAYSVDADHITAHKATHYISVSAEASDSTCSSYVTITNNNASGVWSWLDLTKNSWLNNKHAVNYAVIKYRAPEATDGAKASFSFSTKNGSDRAYYDITLNGDGNWHYAVIDLKEAAPSYWVADKYNNHTVKALGIALTNLAANQSFDLAYIGFATNLDYTKELINNEINLGTASCDHVQFVYGLSYALSSDATSHTATCFICEKEYTEAHTYTANYGLYDSGLDEYVRYCSACYAHSNKVLPANLIVGGNSLINGTKSSGMTATISNNIAKYTVSGTDPYIVGFEHNERFETGKYFFIKCKPSSSNVKLQIFTSTTLAGAEGNGDATAKYDLTAGEWNYLILDMSSLSKFTDVNGKYYAKYARIDVDSNTIGDYLEVEYIGFADDLDRLYKGIGDYDSNIRIHCNHPDAAVADDLCKICGKTPSKDDLKLRFDSEGNYEIAIFSDLRLSTDVDEEVIANLIKIVDEVQPSLVLFGGDIHDGSVTNETELRTILDAINAPLEDRGIYWCHTFGVDSEGLGGSTTGFTRKEQLIVYQSYKYCITPDGAEGVYGVSNYVMPIYLADSNNIGFNVWCLDSNGYLNDKYSGFEDNVFIGSNNFGGGTKLDTMYYSQILWYWNRSVEFQSANGGTNIPSIMYFQVPAYQFLYLQQNPTATGRTGRMTKITSASERESGIVWTCFERGDVKGIFCGYDTQNDYAGTYLGMTLAGCSSIGTTSGRATAGARVISLTNNGSGYSTRMVYAYEEGGKEEIADPLMPDLVEWVPNTDGTATNNAGSWPTITTHNVTASDVSFNSDINKTIVSFNGSNNPLRTYNIPAEELSYTLGDGFAYEVLFNPTATVPSSYVGVLDLEESGGFGMDLYPSTTPDAVDIYAELAVGSTWISLKHTVAINQWYHCVFSFDGTDLCLYINGELVEKATTTESVRLPKFSTGITPYVCIGGCASTYNNGQQGFTGYLAKCNIFSLPLTADHVDTMFAQVTLPTPELKLNPVELKYKADGVSTWFSGIEVMKEGDITFTRFKANTSLSEAFFTCMENGTDVTGQYMFIKYRSNAASNKLQVFASTTNEITGTIGNDYFDLTNDNKLYIADEKWYLTVIDLSKVIGSYDSNDAGEYIGKYLRLDVFNSTENTADSYVDVAYIGIGSDLDEIKSMDEDVAKLYFYDGALTETVVCKNHTGDIYGVWNEEQGCYMSATGCTTCGELYPVMGNLVLDAKTISNSTIYTNSTLTYIEDETYGAFTRHFRTGGGTRFGPYTAAKLNAVETGQYIVVKYKTDLYHPDAGKTPCIGFDATTVSLDYAGDNGAYRDYYYGLTADGEWHYLVVDLSAHKSGFTAHTDGKYYMGYLAVGGYDANGGDSQIDYAYMVTGNNIGNLLNSVRALDADAEEGLAENCTHPSYANISIYKDEVQHSAVCALCGTNLGDVAHSGARYANWDETLGYYVTETACETCGYTYKADYAYMYDNYHHKNVPTSFNSSSYSVNDAGYTTFTKGTGAWLSMATSTWCSSPTYTIPGRYAVIKYRTTNAVGQTISLRFGTTSYKTTDNSAKYSNYDITLKGISGEWHYAVVDLLVASPTKWVENGSGEYNHNYFGFDVPNLTSGSSFDLAYIGMASDLDYLRALINADTDAVCDHVHVDPSNVCYGCGKTVGN